MVSFLHSALSHVYRKYKVSYFQIDRHSIIALVIEAYQRIYIFLSVLNR